MPSWLGGVVQRWSCADQDGCLFDLAIDGPPGFVVLALEVDELADDSRSPRPSAASSSPATQSARSSSLHPLELEQAAVDGVGDPLGRGCARGPATAGRGSPGRWPGSRRRGRPSAPTSRTAAGRPGRSAARWRTIARNSSRAGVDGSWSGPISSAARSCCSGASSSSRSSSSSTGVIAREDPVDRQGVGGADDGVGGDPALRRDPPARAAGGGPRGPSAPRRPTRVWIVWR